MAIQSAQFTSTDRDTIRVTTDDPDHAELFVPDDAENRHRQELAEWEEAGGVIAEQEPPARSTRRSAKD
jgi:hypothetical protein